MAESAKKATEQKKAVTEKKETTTEKKSSKKEKDKLYQEGKSRYHSEVILLITLVVSLLLLLSYFNMAGKIGMLLNNIVFGLVGFLAYIFPICLFISTAFYIVNKGSKVAKRKLISAGCLFLAATGILQLISFSYDKSLNIVKFYTQSAEIKEGGGLLGGLLANTLCYLCGEWGAYVILIALMALFFMLITEKLIFASLGKKGSKTYQSMKEKKKIMDEKILWVKSERAKRKATAYDEAEDYDMEEEYDEYEFADSEEAYASKPYQAVRRNANIVTFPKETEKEEENKTQEDISFPFQKKEKISFPKEQEESQEEPQDSIDNIPIQRAERVKAAGESRELPIYQEELLHKFKEKDNAPEQKKLFDRIEEITKEFLIAEDMEGETEQAFEQLEQEEIAPLVSIPEEEEAIIQEDFLEDTMPESVYQMDEPDTILPTEAYEEVAASQKDNISSEIREAVPIDIEAATLAKKAENKAENKTMPPRPYLFPPIDLLSKPSGDQKGMSDTELRKKAKTLQTTLESFGVGAKVTNVSCGPAVTRFELQPEQGVKVSKITGLADDIKLNLAAAEIRIEAPIPGKAAVGIEVPNRVTTMVNLRDLMENEQFKKHASNLAFAVGKDIGGQTIVTDIAKMPHLLIAGATGSGKSVCINTLIMSILYKAKPEDVKLIMIDPKVVELSVYNGIPHLLIPVVTDPKKASGALHWAVTEMTERYNKFAELGVREIKGYNEKIAAVAEANDPRYEKMPQIVIIVDELADLMMVAAGEVEEAICRLAQLARAAGIHLIIATQRPSVNVITGLIKANVPSRIAFSVSSAIDSRTILDGGGAEKLLGKGDMLFFPSGYPKPIRVQGAFVSDKEVSAVVDFLTQQSEKPQYNEEVNHKIATAQVSLEGSKGIENEKDDYFLEAGKFIIEKNKASIGMLQRVYKIGFNRAARIMDQLCEAGVVGPEEGTKPRKVLMSMEEFQQYIEE